MRNMMRILHVTLYRKWFDAIAAGHKREEYRAATPYWMSRLSKQYDEIHFRNGYAKDAPFMRVEYKGVQRKQVDGQECFAIQLGRILEVRNWTGPAT